MDLIELDRLCRQYAATEYAADDFVTTASLLASTIVPVPNTKGIMIGEIGEKLGFGAQAVVTTTLVEIVDGTIPAQPVPQLGLQANHVRALVKDAHERLLHDTGLRIDSAERQALLDIVGGLGNWDAQITGLTAAIKEMGVALPPTWQYHGLPAAPTAAECQQAKAEFVARPARKALQQKVSIASAAVVTAIDQSDGALTNQDLIAAFSTAITE